MKRDATPAHLWPIPGLLSWLVGFGWGHTWLARNPQGPDASFDPAEPTEKKRVHRGGSFLCTAHYCTRYMVGTRGKGEVSTGSNHVGFRCVKAAETQPGK